MKEIKNQAFALHILALVVPAILEAFQHSGSPVLMIVAQIGAVMFNAITSLHMSSPALPDTGIVEKIPDLAPVVPAPAPASAPANIQLDAQKPAN